MAVTIEKIIPWLQYVIPPALFIAWEVSIWRPGAFFWVAAAVVVIALFGLGGYNRFRVPTRDAVTLTLPPFLLALAVTVLLLFLRYALLQHMIALAAAGAAYAYLRSLYFFLFHISRYKPLMLETLSLYFGIATYFGIAVASFGLMNFLQTPVWYSAVSMLAVTALVTYQYLWINKIDEGRTLLATVLVSVLAAEIAWALAFFPVSHFVTGFVATVLYYAAVNLSLLHFLGKMERKVIRLYLLISAVSITIVLLSAQWL